MTLAGSTTTYNNFNEVSNVDQKIIDFVKKYSNGAKTRSFKSFKNFWRKYVGMVYVIGNGTYEDPEFCFSLTVETGAYVGNPDKVYIYND